MTEFMENVGGKLVNIEATLERDDGKWFLGVRGGDDHDNEIADWVSDDPDAIDEWFRTQAELHAKWNEHYYGIEPPHGHVVPLGPGNSGPGAR